MNPQRVRIVLLRTRHGQNLGAAARALHNFGLSRLVLAELGEVDWHEAERSAVRSGRLVADATRVSTLEAAIDGCAYVVGTTMRRVEGQRDLHPRAAAAELARISRDQEVALVFGGERVGLTNQDLLRCHDVSVIPTSPDLASLNLAQAVVLYAWELSQSRSAEAPPAPARATEAEYAEIESALRRHMTARGFADPDRPRHGALDLLQTLKRAALTPREARLWQAMLRTVSPGADRSRSRSTDDGQG